MLDPLAAQPAAASGLAPELLLEALLELGVDVSPRALASLP
jgi:hypothetical protein